MIIGAESNEIDMEKVASPDVAASHEGHNEVVAQPEGMGPNVEQQKCITGMEDYATRLSAEIAKREVLPHLSEDDARELEDLKMDLEHNRQAQQDAQKGDWAGVGTYSLGVFRDVILPEIAEGRMDPSTRDYRKVERGIEAMKHIHEPTYHTLKAEFDQVNEQVANFKRDVLERMIKTESQLKTDLQHAKEIRQGDWLVGQQLGNLSPAIEDAQAGRWTPLAEFIGNELREQFRYGKAKVDKDDPYVAGKLVELRMLDPWVAKNLERDIEYGRVRPEDPLEFLRTSGPSKDMTQERRESAAPPRPRGYDSSLQDSLARARESRRRIWEGSPPIIWGPF